MPGTSRMPEVWWVGHEDASPGHNDDSRTTGSMTLPQTLTGNQLGRLGNALVAAFPRRDDLAQMVRKQLDTNLNAIVSEAADLQTSACELIKWAESRGRLDDLLRGASFENPGCPALLAFMQSLGLDTDAPPTPPLGEPPRVCNFLAHYRGTNDHPVLFVGREDDLAALDAWLGDPHAPPYLLIEAPAGMGKSALLARWTERLLARPQLEVLFFPISLRFQTNREADLFGYLLPRLGRTAPVLAPSAQKDMLLEALQTPPPEGRTRLVILDGIDEASGWTADAVLVPSAPPAGLRVVVSARAMQSRSWRDQLGWTGPRRAKVLSLAPLTKAEVFGTTEQVLHPQGITVDHAALERLFTLSEGEPFVLWLLLTEAIETRGAVLREGLTSQAIPGLGGYVDRWLHEQETLWKEQGHASGLNLLHSFLHLLACAKGPLTSDDLAELSERDLAATSNLRSATLEALHRLIVRDAEGGYSLAHVHLNWYIRNERMTRVDRSTIARRFEGWTLRVLAEVERNERLPTETPAYLLRFAAEHLDEGRASPEAWETLLGAPWWSAWRAQGDALDLDYQRFVLSVREILARRTRTSVASAKAAPWFALELRCALLASSIVSSHGALPSGLLVAAVTSGLLSVEDAVRFALRYQRADVLSELVAAIQGADQERVLRAMRELRNRHARSRALADALEHVPDPRRPQLAREAYDDLPEASGDYHGMSSNDVIGHVLVRVAPYADGALLGAMLARIPIAGYPFADADVLHAVARRGVLPREVFDGVLSRTEHEPSRMLMLASLWPEYGADGVSRVVAWLVRDAENRRTDYARNAFAFVRDQIDPDRRQLLNGLMSEPLGYPDGPQVDRSVPAGAAWSGGDDSMSNGLVMQFPEPPPPPSWRSMSPTELQSELVAQRQSNDAEVLHEVLRLPAELARDEVRAPVRRLVEGIPAPTPSPEVPISPRTYDEESLRAERESLLRGDFEHLDRWELREVAARHVSGMTPEWRHCVISAARVHPDPEVFVGAVAGIAPSLPLEQRQPLFREAMQRALTIDEPGTPGSQRVAALRGIAEVIDDEMIPEVIGLVEGIDWPPHSDLQQAELVGRLPASLRASHVDRLAERFYLPGMGGSASDLLACLIEALAPHLSQAQCAAALDSIDPTADYLHASAHALSALAPSLGEDQLGRAFKLLVEIQEEDGFEPWLAAVGRTLCTRLLALPPPHALAIWQEALPGFEQQPRRLFVRHALCFARLFERLGSQGTVEHFVRDLGDAFERWR